MHKYENTFKVVKNQHPNMKDFTIADFSLFARGPVEDRIYAEYEFYRNNIRRGNSILYNRK